MRAHPPPRLAAKFTLLLDRLELRLSHSRHIDGMWVRYFGDDEFSPAFGRVEEAIVPLVVV